MISFWISLSKKVEMTIIFFRSLQNVVAMTLQRQLFDIGLLFGLDLKYSLRNVADIVKIMSFNWKCHDNWKYN